MEVCLVVSTCDQTPPMDVNLLTPQYLTSPNLRPDLPWSIRTTGLGLTGKTSVLSVYLLAVYRLPSLTLPPP